MAGYNKFNQFVGDEGEGIYNLDTHVLKMYLTNTTPVATMEIKSELAEITAQNGYPAGGIDVQNTWIESGGTATLGGTSITFTASGGSFGPFRYAVLYDDTPTSPADPLIAWWDYGTSVSTTAPETFKIDILTNLFTKR